MNSEWSLVAPYVLARRKELGLTQEDIKQRGGPSAALVRQLENGNYDAAMNPAIEGGLERALRWKVGSLESIKHGGEPFPEEVRPTSVDAARRLEYIQAANRRNARPAEVFVQWYAARTALLELEHEYAEILGLEPEEGRRNLESILATIGESEAFAAYREEQAEGGSGDGETLAQKSAYGLAAQHGTKEPDDESQ